MGIILPICVVMVAFSMLPATLAAAIMCAIVIAIAYKDPSMRKMAAVVVGFALLAYAPMLGIAALAGAAGYWYCNRKK
ncbi:MAG: hypothetical protein IJV92_06955 [Phascolarctobacterium sp.]|nr:hypothetical protein [Phascolarctobacterium sp.]